MVFGVGLGDDRGIDVLGETALGLGNLCLNILKGEVDVLGEIELHGDRGASLPGDRGDRFDPFHLNEGLFENLHNIVFDDFRGGSLPGGADGDCREVDVRVLADADAGRGD